MTDLESFIEKNRELIVGVFLTVTSYFYELVFKEKVDDGVKSFIQNFSFVGLGTLISTFFSFIFSVIGGRILGPSGYGSYSLVQSIAMILYIPMVLGFNTAMIKYCSESEDETQIANIISTTYIVIILLITLTVLSYLVLIRLLMALFSVDPELILLSIIFSIFFVFYTLSTSILRGLHQMKKLALYQALFGFLLLTMFLILIQSASFKSMIYPYYFAYGLIGLSITLQLKKYITLRIDFQWLKKACKYSFYALIGGLGFTLYSNVDRVIINYYMGVENVGIYGVYYYASFAFIGFLSGIFITIFFPTVSRSQSKFSLYLKLKQIMPYIIILGIPGVFLSEFIILTFFGEKYPINILLMGLFAITAVLVTCYTLFAWFFNAGGIRGVRFTISGTVQVAFVNLVLNIVFIPRIGLYGAILSTTIAFILGFYYIWYYGNKYFDNLVGGVNHDVEK